jgi:hypothetical protein
LAFRSDVVGTLAALSLSTLAANATAGGTLGPNGSPIRTSDYALDLFQGPVFAGTRVTGLGGAYVAIAEDVDGDLQNPASPAVRPFFSYTHFDYWLGFGLTFPADLKNMDFFNSGSPTHLANPPDSFVFFTPAANLQWGELGVGVNVELQQYALTTSSNVHGLHATIPTTHLQFAHGLNHNQWVIGIGARFLQMSVREGVNNTLAFKSAGTGLEFGVVYKPANRPIRVGFALRTGIRTEANFSQGLLPNANGDLTLPDSQGNPIYLPKAVELPLDVNIGVALQFGRPFNPPWRTLEEIVELPTLEHQLRAVERTQRRADALGLATSEAEKQDVERAFDREQAADDRRQAHTLATARRQIETELVKLNRFYVQVSASMLVASAVHDAVGVESLVNQTVDRSGEKAVASFHVGAEAGVLPRLLKVRAGSYVEPTRFDGSSPRVHGTVGLDVKLVPWDVFGLWPLDYVWRLGLGADFAERYATWSFMIGGWYPRHDAPLAGEGRPGQPCP